MISITQGKQQRFVPGITVCFDPSSRKGKRNAGFLVFIGEFACGNLDILFCDIRGMKYKIIHDRPYVRIAGIHIDEIVHAVRNPQQQITMTGFLKREANFFAVPNRNHRVFIDILFYAGFIFIHINVEHKLRLGVIIYLGIEMLRVSFCILPQQFPVADVGVILPGRIRHTHLHGKAFLFIHRHQISVFGFHLPQQCLRGVPVPFQYFGLPFCIFPGKDIGNHGKGDGQAHFFQLIAF